MVCCIFLLFWYKIFSIFDTAVMCLLILHLEVLINLSATTDFSSLRMNTFQCHWHATVTSLIYCKTNYSCLSIFFIFTARIVQIFLKWISNCSSFFVLQQNNPSILAININNIQQKPDSLICLLFICKSARSALQMLSQ